MQVNPGLNASIAHIRVIAGPSFLPITSAGKIHMIMEMMRDTDDDGNPIEPILSKEDIKRILNIGELE